MLVHRKDLPPTRNARLIGEAIVTKILRPIGALEDEIALARMPAMIRLLQQIILSDPNDVFDLLHVLLAIERVRPAAVAVFRHDEVVVVEDEIDAANDTD
jgi:hypothetical protein